jgi:hypothetical protein
MSDKVLLILIALGLGFGGFRLVTNLLNPEPTETAELVKPPKAPQKKPETTEATPASSAPVAVAPIPTPTATPAPVVKAKEKPVEKKSRISDEEMSALYRVNGIGSGTHGRMIIINNTSLHEGEELGELRVEKIMTKFAKILYRGNIYQIAPQYIQSTKK